MQPMIYRLYGTSYQSVDMDFDAKALNYIGFRRNSAASVPADEFDTAFSLVERHDLTAEAEGSVQLETKQELLDLLGARVTALLGQLPEGGMLVVENKAGHDYPKTLQEMKNVIVDGENRLYFEYTMKSPLRVALYRPVSG